MHNNDPTASELEILQFLWDRGKSSVKEVHNYLIEEKQKEIRYTTTLKTMQVMYERGLVKREAVGRKHLYNAAIRKDATERRLVDEFLNFTFGGSALKLIMQVLGNHQPTRDELEELKEYIESIEKKYQNGDDQ